MQPSFFPFSNRRKLKVFLWRSRFFFLGITIFCASCILLDKVTGQDGQTRPVLVITKNVSVGQVVTAADVTVNKLKISPWPPNLYTDMRNLPAGPLAISLSAGMPLWKGAFLQENLLDKAPAGMVVVNVKVPKQTSVDLLRAGRKVDIYGTLVGENLVQKVADEALVIGVKENTDKSTGMFNTHNDDVGEVYLAVHEKQVSRVLNVLPHSIRLLGREQKAS